MAKPKENRNGNSNKKNIPDNDDVVQMPLWFAREMIRQVTNNPRNASSKKSQTYSLYTKENILRWLQTPTLASSEKSLRDASNYMYLSSMHYNRLLNYYAGLYIGAYVISPVGFNPEEVKVNFAKQFRRVSNALERLNVANVLREEILIALRDGAFYGVLLSDNNSAFIQKIDPDYCRITAICDGSFLYKVDMTKIANKLEFYPAEFVKMYNDYLATGDQWQEVPMEISVCVKADSSLVDYTIPPFASVMPSLYTIANTESLQETATELKNYKMIHGQIPYDDKGHPLMADRDVDKYYYHIANALGDNVGFALSPFDLKAFTFEQKAGIADVDDLGRAVANFWSNAGTSGLLHGRDNDTAGVMKLAIKNDETYILGLVQQVERVINRYLKTAFPGTSKFKIDILPITVFNRDEYLKYYKEAASFGLGKSQYAAALGIRQSDVGGLNYIEKEIVPFDELMPLKSSYTSGGEEGPGRPESDEGELTREGQSTRDNDTNANR